MNVLAPLTARSARRRPDVHTHTHTHPPMQLDLYGNEVALAVATRVPRSLSDSQRAILRQIRAKGYIRSVEAGMIIHACRTGGLCANGPLRRSNAIGCCRYAASDGGAACKRMAERGLLAKLDRGLWGKA